MTTALTLITDALTEIGVTEQGQALAAEDSALALRYLNRILERWSNMRLLIPSLTRVSVPLTGAGSYTIGPSGADVTAARPNKVLLAYYTDGTTDYPVRILNQEQWNAIAVKDIDAPPESVYYKATVTNGTVYVYPDASGYTLKLECQSLITSFASTATTLTLPEGYESALVLTLADDLCAPFQAQMRPDLQRRAAAATRALKRTNYEPLIVNAQPPQDFQIERGY